MTIVIATAEKGNTFHSQGLALAQLLGERGFQESISVITTTGSVANAQLIGNGQAQFGFMAANWAPLATAGKEPFGLPIDLAMVSPVNSGPLFFVVAATSSIRSFDDLRGRKVAIGYPESGMARHVTTVLAAIGWRLNDIQPVYLNQADGGVALAEGRIDAQFQPPLPNAHFSKLVQRMDVRVVRFSPEQLEAILAGTPVYARVTMRAGAFRGHDQDVDTFGVLNVLVAGRSVSDATVGAVARLFAAEPQALAARHPLYDSLPALIAAAKSNSAALLEPGGVALHPAARKAFQAAGILP